MSSFYGNGGYSSGGGGGSGEVISVNGKKGQVTLNAADVHALPDNTQIPSLEGFATEAWVNNQDFLTDENTYLIKIIKEFTPDQKGRQSWSFWDENEQGYNQIQGFWDFSYDVNFYGNKTQAQIATEIFNQVNNNKIPICILTIKVDNQEIETSLSYLSHNAGAGTVLSPENINFLGAITPAINGSDHKIWLTDKNVGFFDILQINSLGRISENHFYNLIYKIQIFKDNNDILTFAPTYDAYDINSPADFVHKVYNIERMFVKIPIIALNYTNGETQYLQCVYSTWGQTLFIGKRCVQNEGVYKLTDILIKSDNNNIIYQQYEPNIPTNVSDLNNDAGYLTQHQDISGKADKTEIILKPATAGTQGQVLTIDANGNPKWDNTSFVKVTDDGQGNVSMETLYGVLIDAAPAQNSNNLVTSGGIYTAINNAVGNIETLLAQI